MGERYFSDKIAEWYAINKRPLPWRDTREPYFVWLSEVILQQTRVAQGLPYYQRFVDAFPSLQALAAAPEQKVLRLWQGLGYYTRARNLHKCAKHIVLEHSGRFPQTFAELLKLPGIGEYTAAAIASFCFGEEVAVLDGNVFRVLSRVFGIETPINTPDGKKQFSKFAGKLLSRKDPALHNQAIMEFGALLCTPRNPRCAQCPFHKTCFAHRQGVVNLLPVKQKAKKTRTRYFYYLVIERDRSLLMRQRREKDIWHGLFDFFLIEKSRPVLTGKLIAANAKWFAGARSINVSKTYKHVLSHQTIRCRFIHVQPSDSFKLPDKEMNFYAPAEVAELPKPALISRFLHEQKAY